MAAKVNYKVSITTGDVRDAGTDCEVFFHLLGEKGDSGKIIPPQNKKNFERGTIDVFNISVPDVGPLTKLRIGHNNKAGVFAILGSGWFLDNVVVENTSNGSVYRFPCSRWIDDKKEDKQIVRELPVENLKAGERRLYYKVIVKTADVAGAGTDSNVTICLYGTNGESGMRNLDSTKDNFEKGNIDEFFLECLDLGTLQKIKIGHDGKEIIPGSADWKCETVIIEDPKRGKYEFPINDWFGKKQGLYKEFSVKEVAKSGAALYSVSVKTGDIRGAGTKAKVFVILTGSKDNSGKRFLDNSPDNFSRGALDTFSIETIDLGDIVKVTVGHDNTGWGADWFLENISVKNESSGKEWHFACGRWFSDKQDDKLLVREITASTKPASVACYKVIVKTGSIRGAGTDANVYINIQGENGASGVRSLDNNWDNFERSKSDKFSIECVDLGELNGITIGHDNAGLGPAWFLDTVVIQNPNNQKEWKFPCGRWLAKDEDDAKIERFLQPSDKSAPAEGDYQVTVLTGNRRGSGTDANVFIQIYGKKSSTHKQQLNNKHNNFETGATDVFSIQSADLGDLTKIRIGHDGKGFGAGWFLEKVTVKNLKTNVETFFVASRWLAKDEGDKLLEIEIPASKEDSDVAPILTYKITTYTGDRRGAGTDANVFITIFGENGDSGEKLLDNELNNFERGKIDSFGLQAVDLGELKQIQIRHDGSGFGAGWFMEKIEISSGTGDAWYFPHSKWLAKDEEDGKISRIIEAKKLDTPLNPTVVYRVDVLTGDRRGAGTDANVYIEICGEKGTTTRHILDNSSNNFERNQTDTFGVESADLGKLTKIRIGHDNFGFGSAWFLDKVIITSEKTKEQTYFMCGDWLEKDHCDKELPAANKDGQTYLPLSQYKVTIHTGDRRGAGTDANVFVVLTGKNGDSGKRLLDAPGNLFERNKVDTFGLQCVELGDLVKIRVGHDNAGIGPAWFLEKVVVRDEKAEKDYFFPCGKWFSKRDGDKMIEREIPAVGADGVASAPLIQYKVSITTGDRWGAGTDANVFINLIGETGETGDRNVDPKGNSFERAQVDVVGIEAVDLGKLKKIRIGHDNAGIGAAWFLDKVVVLNTKTNEENYFLCGQWLAKDEGDGLLVRDIAAASQDGVSCLPLKNYNVKVKTGDRWGAGTDANVFIIIYGENGDSEKRFLANSRNNFERNQVDEFDIQCVALGELKSIHIGHDGRNPGAGWFLDKVIITATDGTWYFLAGRWLASDEADNKLEIDILPLKQDGQSCQPLITYKISVFTGDRRGAGTDANVFLKMFGELTESGPHNLQNSQNNFEKGRTDIFSFQEVNIGDLKKISIGHDNSGAGPGWFLNKIVIETGDGRGWTFGANRWLAKDEGDANTEIEIEPTLGEFKSANMCSYRVSVTTGDRRGAGTNANVSITLFGEGGKHSKQTILDTAEDNFERNKTDEFIVESEDLGELTKIRIGHDGSGLFDAWFLDKAVVTSEKLNKEFFFIAGKWLDSKNGTVTEIGASGADGVSYLPLVKYTVKVKTGDRRFAGTDANVFINIVGSEGDTGERELNTAGNNFERNQWDEFEVEAVSVGDIKKIRIGHDGRGPGAGWFLEKVVVVHPVSKVETFFLCGRWLDRDEDDGQIVREIAAQTADGVACDPMVRYYLKVFTGDRRGAGTDADVYVILAGEKGETRNTKLQGSGNLFERNNVDEFTIEAVDLGELKRVTVGHDNSGVGPGWFLDKIIVREEKSGKQLYFLCGRWLDKSEDDGKIERDLEVSAEDATTYDPLSIYDVDVITGDRSGAGTNAKVSLTIFGSSRVSEPTVLESKKDDFERKTSTHFSFSCVSVGEIQKIRIEHDNSGFAPGWFLDKVIITDNSNAGQKFYFHAGRWLATDEEDGNTFCEIAANTEDKETYLPLSMYHVAVLTGDRPGAGTDADVSINIIGDKGQTGPTRLDSGKNNFERSSTDKFVIDAVELGEIKQIVVGHNNRGPGPAWFLDKVIIKSESLSKYYYFLCGKWLATDEDDGQIQRTLDAQEMDGVASADLVSYRIEVYTGDKRGAGTDANVSVTLFGDDGNSGPRLLDNNQNNFERNKKDVFWFECVDLGENIQRLRIGHDNSGFAAGWFLEKAVVIDQKRKKTYFFLCGQWFDKDEGDGQLERELGASSEDGVVTIPPRAYSIKVTTGDRDGAGTDSHVSITIHGEAGSTPELRLDKKGNNFERNQTSEFQIATLDVGALKKIEIGHDNAGFGAAWFLEKVAIKPIALEGEADYPEYYFFCGRWLAKDEDDGQISRELIASTTDDASSPPWVHYKVKVYTGDRRGAGTDANVFIVIYGENGETGKRKLDKKGDLFERAQVDVFELELLDLGDIQKIVIGHDNKGAGPGWFLDKIVIESGTGKSYFFAFGRWFATDEDDGQIVREAVPAPEDTVTYLPEVNYNIKIFTGDRAGAGTDAHVFIELYGADGKSGMKVLDNGNDSFERKKCDTFGLNCVFLGDLKKIRIGHDNSGIGPAWFLDKVIVHSEKEQKDYFFLSGKWLSTSDDDCVTEREISASGEDGQPSLPSVMYKLSITTGDRWGAGTDANVFVTLYGENGDSGKRVVDPKGNSFERGRVDVVGIEAIDLGKLTKIIVGHDDSGLSSGWFLDKIVATNSVTNEETFFLCGKWLAKDEDDGSIVREVPASGADGATYLPIKSYNVLVQTGDRWGAGTDANVFIIIYGANGDSGKRPLTNSKNNFERNRLDEFNLQCVELGEINRIHIGHDGKNPGAAWFLDKVTIQSGDGQQWYFLAGRWLGVNEDDKKIAIDLVAQKEDGVASKPLVTYKVSVLTGDRRGAGTDANVFIELIGSEAESGKSLLDNGQNNFERNKEDVFYVKAEDLQEIKKIRIGHDNSGFGPAWFLEKVTVHDEKAQKTYYFLSGKWLAKDEEDGQIVREIGASSEDGTLSEPLKTYEVTVVTGDRRGAGTNANVFITLFGSKGDTGQRTLDNAKKWPTFTRKGTDVFGIECVDLGDLRRILIGHDNSGIAAGWFLEKVIIRDQSTSKEWFFLCGKWLADDEDDKQTVREIVSQGEDGQASEPLVRYRLTITTGDRRGAGTDAKVFVRLTGTKGHSGDRFLEGKFERAMTEEFQVECVNLSDITKLKIGHDNSGFGAGWFLDKIKIRNEMTSQEYYFLAGRWLDKSEGDGKTEIELSPQNKDGVASKPLITYQIVVKTGDVPGAGTNSKISIKLIGEKGSTEQKLLDAQRGSFERGSVDSFGFDEEDLGNLLKLKVSSDNSGLGSDWFLDKISVKNQVTSQEWFFLCGSWISEKKGLERELPASSSDKDSYPPWIQYQVSVVTGNHRGAGTNANVFINLVGKLGESGIRILDTAKDNFERGKTDVFQVECLDLGQLEKIRLGHDNSSFSPAWFCDHVTIMQQSSGEKWEFPCRKWFSKHEDDRQIERDLYVGGQPGRAILFYRVHVITGVMKGAGTDSDVYLSLVGTLGRLEKVRLDSSRNNFEQGRLDTFTLEVPDLGDIQQAIIGIRQKGLFSAWYCDKIFVCNDEIRKVWYFPCAKWFDKRGDDKKVERELVPGSLAGRTIYELKIKTGKLPSAGTDANVYININGVKGNSGKIDVKYGNHINKFESGQEDIFSIDSPDVGDVNTLTLGHDGGGLLGISSWYVESVKLTDIIAHKSYKFIVNKWFDKKRDDKLLERVLKPAVDGESHKSYNIKVVTGTKSGAGTDANVHVIITGKLGSTSKTTLDESGNKNKFEDGQTDIFNIDANDVGEITSLTIGHDDSGWGAAWYLDYVEIIHSGVLYRFDSNQWFDSKAGDKKKERVLQVTKTSAQQNK